MSTRHYQRYAESVKDDIGRYIDLIGNLQVKSAPITSGGRVVPKQRFNNAILLTDSLHAVAVHDRVVYDTKEIFDIWPVSARLITDGIGSLIAPPMLGEVASMWSLESVTARQVKGKIYRPYPRMMRLSQAFLYPDNDGYEARTSEYIYGLKPDGSLIANDIGKAATAAQMAHEQRWVQLLAGLSLSMRYSWSVDIRAIPDGLTVRIPTSPEGARQLLSLRDVEDGRKRRRALRHWVSAHARRRTREDALKGVDVKSHLRGVTPFTWEEFEGVVRPSEYDLERNTRGV